MDLKNIIKYQYLNDLLYIFSGALANSWLSSEFSFIGSKTLFLDNYLIEGNSFLYVILYLSFSFVLGVFLRESGEFIYRGTTWVLKKLFNIKIKKYSLTLLLGSGDEPEDDKYFRYRYIARVNAHLIFTAFFFLSIFLITFSKEVNYSILILFFILFINSIRNVNQLLKE